MTTPGFRIIGQRQLAQRVESLIADNNYPRFSIFIGDRGSGRQTMIHASLQKLGICQDCNSDVESVRDVIEQAYKVVSPIVYVFANADAMSVSAKNALLKVTEEPPNNAYFVMTLVNAENTLNTIRSRASVFLMDSYTKDEIITYYHRGGNKGDEDIIQAYCDTPGDVDLLCSYKIKEFYDFVKMVLENVEKVSGANSFKIGNRLSLGLSRKDDDLSSSNPDDGKYDLALFWKAFRAECLLKLVTEQSLKYSAGVRVTSKYLYDLRVSGINRQMCFDSWLLSIRKEWMDYGED